MMTKPYIGKSCGVLVRRPQQVRRWDASVAGGYRTPSAQLLDALLPTASTTTYMFHSAIKVYQ